MRLTELLVRLLVGLFLPLFHVVDLETRNGLMPADKEFMMQNRLFIMPGVEHSMQIIVVDLCLPMLRPRGNTLKHSTCSHKWWETVKGSIVGVKTSIPALRGP